MLAIKDYFGKRLLNALMSWDFTTTTKAWHNVLKGLYKVKIKINMHLFITFFYKSDQIIGKPGQKSLT